MQNYIFQSFLEWVQKDPSRPAIIDLKESFSYEQLYKKAIHIALALESYKDLNINHVAILGNKCNNSIAAILGVLFAGFAYCPLDINLPCERYDKIFSILSPTGVILTGLTPSIKYAFKKLKIKPSFILDLEGDLPNDIFQDVKILNLKQGDFTIQNTPKNPAYIIFTSGSTGTPKGVSISHKAAISALAMFQEHICIQKTDKICNQVALCFDLSVFDIFGSLNQGASIYLIPATLSAFPKRLSQYINDKALTSLFTVPSSVTYLIENTNTDLKHSSLRNLLLSGEPISTLLIEKISKFFPDFLNLWNLYGATEVPYVLAENVKTNKMPNYFTLKGTGVEVRTDETGELQVKSPAMLSGYHIEGKSEISLPFIDKDWYPTGDRALIDHEGNVTISGRKDRQVKIQGHRIELDEIERFLESYQEVIEAAVILLENEKILIAFLVVNSTQQGISDHAFFDEKCKNFLPPVMCPQHYFFISHIPRTPSNKKNRKALLELDIVKTIKKD